MKQELSEIEGSAHDFGHVDRVTRIASYLAKCEGADRELVQVASLIHDIGRLTGEQHAQAGVEPARRILKDIDYPEKIHERVLWIVANHDVRGRVSYGKARLSPLSS